VHTSTRQLGSTRASRRRHARQGGPACQSTAPRHSSTSTHSPQEAFGHAPLSLSPDALLQHKSRPCNPPVRSLRSQVTSSSSRYTSSVRAQQVKADLQHRPALYARVCCQQQCQARRIITATGIPRTLAWALIFSCSATRFFHSSWQREGLTCSMRT
jgi:hypothetical protein